MKVTTTLRLAALLGVVAFAGTAQAQISCDANASSTSTLNGAANPAAPHCDLNTNATASVKHVLRLTLSSGTTQLGVAGVVDMAQFDSTTAAVTATDVGMNPFNLGPQVSAKGNRPFDVYIHRSAANFTYAAGTGDGNTFGPFTVTKSGADLYYAIAANTTPLTAGFASVPVVGSAAKILDSAVDTYTPTKQVQYRTAWNYATDRPGDYSIGVVYTIVGK